MKSILVILFSCLSCTAQVATLRNANVGGVWNTKLFNPTSGLVGWWKMDEGAGTIAADAVNANTVNWTNSPAWASGVFGSAINLNGTTQFGVATNSIPLGVTNVTLAYWLNRNSAGSFGHVLSKWTSYMSPIQHDTSAGGVSNSVKFTVWIGGVGKNLVAPTNVISVGLWSHVVCTYNGSISRIYINGVESTNSAGAWSGNIDVQTNALNIGRYEGGGAGFFLNGLIDDVRIYNRALSALEVQQLYNWRP